MNKLSLNKNSFLVINLIILTLKNIGTLEKRKMSTTDLIHLKENQVKALLNWPLVYEAVEESLRSIPSTRVNESQPIAEQPTRIFTKMPNNAGNLDVSTCDGFNTKYY